jgi:hypothetical protein
LKRKREVNEDADLYGEEAQVTDKKPRGDHSDSKPAKKMDVEFAINGDDTTASEELEWLLFLVSHEGALQVLCSVILN